MASPIATGFFNGQPNPFASLGSPFTFQASLLRHPWAVTLKASFQSTWGFQGFPKLTRLQFFYRLRTRLSRSQRVKATTLGNGARFTGNPYARLIFPSRTMQDLRATPTAFFFRPCEQSNYFGAKVKRFFCAVVFFLAWFLQRAQPT